VTALYDVVLLDGSPQRLTLRLAPEIVREDTIEVGATTWLVADVRTAGNGAVQLICIHPD
jgi:hypothetical protein